MKVLCIDDYKYCEMFQGVHDNETLQNYLNENYNRFVRIKKFDDSECVVPYLINKYVDEYINIATITNIQIVDVEVLEENEYLQRLDKVVRKYCVDCESYRNGDDLSTHRDKISLDGKCPFKELYSKE